MKKHDSFSTFHPVVNFIYFTLVLVFTMFFLHPVFLGVSFFCALAYYFYLNGVKIKRAGLIFILSSLLLTALINPLFNHRGTTILAYFPNGNPLTLESALYGIAAAFMLAAAVLWFGCYNKVMTGDKFVFLFGRIAPALSIVLALTLRFIPRFRAQLKIISQAQRCSGHGAAQGGIPRKIKNGIVVMSIMTTWALENSVETADSMRSRGSGLPGRTAFSIYRFDRRDGAALGLLLIFSAYIAYGALAGHISFFYFPSLSGFDGGFFSYSLPACYFVLCSIPLAVNLKEDVKWLSLNSKI